MRVVHFVEALKGGPATYLDALLPFQIAAYGQVAVLCPRAQAQFVRTPGVEIVTFPDTPRTLAGIARLIAHWHDHIRARRYDIAHLHSSFAGFAGRLGWRRASPAPRIVYCAHGWAFGMETAKANKAVYRFVERHLARRTDAIVNISASEDALARGARLPAHRSNLVHNGLADSAWEPLPAGRRPLRLLFVGRYDRQKGLDILLDAMRSLTPLGFTLTTIGGPVIGKPSINSLPDHVRDLGWRGPGEIAVEMGKADIVVMPSRWDGMSLVALEAMRAGRPIVGSAVGALPEQIEDGVSGVLCKPGSPLALAAAVSSLRDSDIRAMGLCARARYEANFTAGRMFERIDALYRRLAGADT